jgi:hypothetical protein
LCSSVRSPASCTACRDKKSRPVDAKASPSGEPIAFDLPVRIAPGPKFYGEYVRSEGPQRRFVYVAVGAQAGDPSAPWSRRMKIYIHDMPQALLGEAARGDRLEGAILAVAADGSPACATVCPIAWRVSPKE